MCALSLDYSCCSRCRRLSAATAAAADNRKCRKKNETIYNCIILHYTYRAILLHGGGADQQPPTARWNEKLKTIMCVCVTHKNWQIRVIQFFLFQIFQRKKKYFFRNIFSSLSMFGVSQFVWFFVMCKFNLICLPLRQTIMVSQQRNTRLFRVYRFRLHIDWTILCACVFLSAPILSICAEF